MIVTFILNALYVAIYLILLPINLLPDATLPAGITTAIATISSYIALLYSLLPAFCLAMLGFIATLAGIEGYVLGYKFTMWIVRKFPGIG